jgi:hypothetical protein
MGEPARGAEKRTFVGVSVSSGSDPAKLSEAFASAAEQAIEAGLIGGTDDEGNPITRWFEVTKLEVELGNQHPRTVKATVTG